MFSLLIEVLVSPDLRRTPWNPDPARETLRPVHRATEGSPSDLPRTYGLPERRIPVLRIPGRTALVIDAD
ncbi:hypothetical protein GCM10009626_34850 [Brachybacterium sacelli]